MVFGRLLEAHSLTIHREDARVRLYTGCLRNQGQTNFKSSTVFFVRGLGRDTILVACTPALRIRIADCRMVSDRYVYRLPVHILIQSSSFLQNLTNPTRAANLRGFVASVRSIVAYHDHAQAICRRLSDASSTAELALGRTNASVLRADLLGRIRNTSRAGAEHGLVRSRAVNA